MPAGEFFDRYGKASARREAVDNTTWYDWISDLGYAPPGFAGPRRALLQAAPDRRQGRADHRGAGPLRCAGPEEHLALRRDLRREVARASATAMTARRAAHAGRRGRHRRRRHRRADARARPASRRHRLPRLRGGGRDPPARRRHQRAAARERGAAARSASSPSSSASPSSPARRRSSTASASTSTASRPGAGPATTRRSSRSIAPTCRRCCSTRSGRGSAPIASSPAMPASASTRPATAACACAFAIPTARPRGEVEAAVAVGCDGIHSALRRQLYPDEGPPRWSGVNMWRGVVPHAPFLSGATMVRAGWLSVGKMVIYPIRNAIDGHRAPARQLGRRARMRRAGAARLERARQPRRLLPAPSPTGTSTGSTSPR